MSNVMVGNSGGKMIVKLWKVACGVCGKGVQANSVQCTVCKNGFTSSGVRCDLSRVAVSGVGDVTGQSRKLL